MLQLEIAVQSREGIEFHGVMTDLDFVAKTHNR